ncbi:molecular chaperone DnaJ [Gracilaria domingensis]|nr:molecular chaperone DnaJ [Gracilaria domingensis]
MSRFDRPVATYPANTSGFLMTKVVPHQAVQRSMKSLLSEQERKRVCEASVTEEQEAQTLASVTSLKSSKEMKRERLEVSKKEEDLTLAALISAISTLVENDEALRADAAVDKLLLVSPFLPFVFCFIFNTLGKCVPISFPPAAVTCISRPKG